MSTIIGAIIIILCIVVIWVPAIRVKMQIFLDSTLGVLFNKRRK